MSRVSSSACSSGKSRAGRETRRNAFRNRRVARHMTSVGARSRLRSQPRRANGLAAASRLASFSDGGGDRLRAGGARAASRASRTQSAVSYFESSWSRPPRPSSARRDRRRRRCTEVIGEVCRSLASGERVVKTMAVIDSRQRKSLATIRVSLTPSTPSADTTQHRDAATVRNERRLRKTPEFGTRRLDLAPSGPRNTLRTCPL